MIKGDLFYTPNCEGSSLALDNLKTVLERVGERYELKVHTILSNDDARRFKVIGSPTILINGRDVEDEVNESKDYGIKCRTYREGQNLLNAPSKKMILSTINNTLPDPVICYCKDVRRSAILDAIKNGARIFKEVQQMTGASTGNECEIKNPTGKCCSPFVDYHIKGWEGIRGVKTCCEGR